MRHLQLGLLAGLGLQFGISFLLTCILEVLHSVGSLVAWRLSASSSCNACFEILSVSGLLWNTIFLQWISRKFHLDIKQDSGPVGTK